MNRGHSLCGAILLLLACIAVPAQDSPSEAKPGSLYGIAKNSLSGEPLAHVEVWLQRKISGHSYSYRHTETGPDGRFSLTGIEAGSYFLSADRNGYHRLEAPVSRDLPMLSLKPGENIKDIVLRLEPDAIIAGRVVDANGMPMERVKVEALGHTGSIPNETDDRGEFAVGGLHPGQYLLRASLRRFRLFRPPEVRKDGSIGVNYDVAYFPSSKTFRGAVPVRVQAGRETEVEIRMLPAPVLHISGEVSVETGGRRPEVKLENRWDDPRTCDIDEKGAFTFARVPAGRYQLYAENWINDTYLRSAPVLVDVANDSIEGIHLSLLPQVVLTGHIVDGDWKRMRALIKKREHKGTLEIRLESFGFFVPQSRYTSALSDDGGFEIKNLSPGRYYVTMTGGLTDFYLKSLQIGDLQFHDETLEIGEGPVQQEMLIELGDDGAEVTGIVRDEKGAVSGAVVVLLIEDASFPAIADAVRSSEDGTYAIYGIAPGKYKLLALSTKYAEPFLTDEELELDRNVTEKLDVRQSDRITQDLKMVGQY
jgi:hypothetical protein